MPLREAEIGVFDSGVGGVSVLAELLRLMPLERFAYYGDSRNAPYGTKPETVIRELTEAAADTLVARGVKELVIACNTATSAAASALRERLSIPVIGIEPAVKPAARVVADGRMLVMATPATIRQEKLHRLVREYGKNAELLPCPGLMEFTERLEMNSPALSEYLARLFAPYAGQRIDACVLGCTHYSFLTDAIQRALPGVPLFDGNVGTARQARRILASCDLLCESRDDTGEHTAGICDDAPAVQTADGYRIGAVTFLTSGDAAAEEPRFRELLRRAMRSQSVRGDIGAVG